MNVPEKLELPLVVKDTSGNEHEVSGTCKVESMHGYTDAHTHTSWCVELSCHTLDAWEDSIPPSYCPICGARVVE